MPSPDSAGRDWLKRPVQLRSQSAPTYKALNHMAKRSARRRGRGHGAVRFRPSVESGIVISVPVSICGTCFGWHGVGTVILAGNHTSKAASTIVPGTGQAILLTGATGFVGMAVLARLLERTDRDVLVLVRASSRSQADVRLNALLGSVRRSRAA